MNSFELKKSGNLGFLMEISEDDFENQSQSSQVSKNSVGFGQSINQSAANQDVKQKSLKKRQKQFKNVEVNGLKRQKTEDDEK